MTLDINSVKFETVYGFRCINLTLLGKQFGKLPQNYLKTKKCATWIKVNNESLKKSWNQNGEYISPECFYFVRKENGKNVYYTRYNILAHDFIHYCSSVYAFKNTLRLTELWFNPDKYDSNLEAEIIGKKVMDNLMEKLDINEIIKAINE